MNFKLKQREVVLSIVWLTDIYFLTLSVTSILHRQRIGFPLVEEKVRRGPGEKPSSKTQFTLHLCFKQRKPKNCLRRRLINSRFALCCHFSTTTRMFSANSLLNSNSKFLGD